MDHSSDQAIIDKICDYSEKNKVKEILKEYCKRLILEKPQDPIGFLIKSIQDQPVTPDHLS